MKCSAVFLGVQGAAAWGSSLGFLSRRPVEEPKQPAVSVTEEVNSSPAPHEASSHFQQVVSDLHKMAREKVDVNQDGHLDSHELASFTHKLREKERHMSTSEEMSRWDTNKDGKVELAELHGDLSKLPQTEAIQNALRAMNEKFELCDSNKDGSLQKNELMVFLHPELDPAALALEARQQLEHLDRNKDGGVDLNEYQVEFGSLGNDDAESLTPTHLDAKEFHLHDHDGDGKLNLAEMKELVEGHKYIHSAIDDLIGSIDNDNDGRISIDEFESHSHSQLIDSVALEDWLYHRHDEL